LRLTTPQLSDVTGLGVLTERVHVPELMVVLMFAGQVMVGAIPSTTFTIEVHVDELPLTSVTVRVTVFGPISEQSNPCGDTLMLAMEQLSPLPLLTRLADRMTNGPL
ncbi:MAG: hypothetical protein ACK58T_16800, partial [Phycisphaerae bacterium]